MKEFKTEKYKNITIKYFVYEDGMFSATAVNLFSSYNTEKDRNINNCYPVLQRAENDIKKQNRSVLTETPKNFKELAESLTGHLTWIGYEDCYLDEFVCKTIVENFIKIYKSK